ncbi:DUF5819 family protein [Streptomyces sp. NBC_01497]|uniref:DUF5819 family protein n=1 Tax=Streptomyces sp. NBC_01497 TaxID=2903885 RepID=UPI002E34CD32|nr:DUF5819 family protein [Streptomyces sp. NBC_01497]
MTGPASPPAAAAPGPAGNPGPEGAAEAADGADGTGQRRSGPGIAGLPRRYRIVAGVGLVAALALVCTHLAMVFFYVAPANAVSKQHAQLINRWVNPEFEQNWKLFAPNPLQQNIHVQARFDTVDASGRSSVSGWRDLSGEDGAAILHNPLPSHTEQNELRRAWDYFTQTHDAKERPIGSRGKLSEAYLRRIVVLRFGKDHLPGRLTGIEVRSATTAVAPPAYAKERVDTRTFYRTFPWWTVGPGDVPGGVPKTVVAARGGSGAGTGEDGGPGAGISVASGTEAAK